MLTTFFELQYRDIVPKIYIEENLLQSEKDSITDYKFFCFNGNVFCLYVMIYTYPEHSKAKLGIYDRDYCLLPYHRSDFEPITDFLEKPKNYSKSYTLLDVKKN